MEIKKITDKAFRKYGKIVANVDFTELVVQLKTIEIPSDSVAYEPSISKLEKLPVFQELTSITYGELPIQIGYCNGNNYQLNALEYHRSSEINVAATDAILLLGAQADITEEDTYDTSLVEAFFLPEGTAVELYATTLHYAPCNANENGFQVGIVLPRDTNLELLDLHKGKGEDAHLTARNKWLYGHPEGVAVGAPIGLIGENINLKK